jgi:hypothetical protein
VPKSVVTPTCSLRTSSEKHEGWSRDADTLCDRQQIVAIDAHVFPALLVRADAAGIHHFATLLICLWVQQVVTLGAKVEGRLGVRQPLR